MNYRSYNKKYLDLLRAIEAEMKQNGEDVSGIGSHRASVAMYLSIMKDSDPERRETHLKMWKRNYVRPYKDRGPWPDWVKDRIREGKTKWCSINGKFYRSVWEAAKDPDVGVSRRTIVRRIKNPKYPEWIYLKNVRYEGFTLTGEKE